MERQWCKPDLYSFTNTGIFEEDPYLNISKKDEIFKYFGQPHTLKSNWRVTTPNTLFSFVAEGTTCQIRCMLNTIKMVNIFIVRIEFSHLVNIRPDGDTDKGEGQQSSGYIL